MIGRLVQQQKQRRARLCEHAGQARAQAFAAAQRAGCLQRRLVAKRKTGQRGVGLVVGQTGIEPAQIVENAGAGIEQADMLIEHRDPIGQAADIS